MDRQGQLRELRRLTAWLDDSAARPLSIISWASPVIAFGSLATATVATLGLNPSNREFVDADDVELDGLRRRFPTLNSLGLRRWADADSNQIELIRLACERYFHNKPYDAWFRPLDNVISGIGVSYYSDKRSACHLDLVPFATDKKWGLLEVAQRAALLSIGRATLARTLRSSTVRVLVLNGRSVIREFQRLADCMLESENMPNWALRSGKKLVAGCAFKGRIIRLGDERLGRSVLVLGFNHNIQSSFGVTRSVVISIRDWLKRCVDEARCSNDEERAVA